MFNASNPAMVHLFEITEAQISALQHHDFRPLLNRLIVSEGQKHSVARRHIETSDVDNVSDDGVDARIVATPRLSEHAYLPDGPSVWQFKAGTAPAGSIKHESQKPGVQEAIEQGYTYCFVIGEACTDRMRRSREQALDEVFQAKGLTPRWRLLTASDIAAWASEYPAAVSSLLRITLPDQFYTFEQWLKRAETRASLEFQLTEQRQTIIEETTKQLSDSNRTIAIRIVGADGIGKTRLALEIVRHAEVEQFTYYAATPDALPESFFSFSRNRPSISRIVMVIDECNDEEFGKLWEQCQLVPHPTTLVAIGSGVLGKNGELEPHVFYYQPDQLSFDQVTSIVSMLAPELPREVPQYVAHVTNGLVKLATAMAEALVVNRNINSVSQLTRLPRIESILRTLAGDNDDYKAMQVLSVLQYVGIEKETRAEAQLLAEFINVNYATVKEVALSMARRGLLIRRGRYAYITPTLLAAWYAQRVWDARGDEIVDELLPQLSQNDMLLRLLNRLNDIGEERYGTPLVNKYFGTDGLYTTVDDLDNERIARLFASLSSISPKPAMAALLRILRSVSHERLLEFRNGRRNIIYALEKHLLIPETCLDAARLMLRFADAENETWGNNATGIWSEIFSIHRGSTALPAVERNIVLREALESPRPSIRKLALKALGRQFSLHSFGISGFGPTGRLVEPWRPKIWREVWDSYKSGLELLDLALKDPSSEIRTEASITLIDSARTLIKTPLEFEILKRLQTLVEEPSEQIRRHLLDSLEQLLRFEDKELETAQKHLLEQWCESLRGHAYADRLHRWLGKLTWSDREAIYRKEGHAKLDNIIAQLADEAISNPELLEPELGWLASRATTTVSTFALELGKFDEHRYWFSRFIDLVSAPNGPFLLSQYMWGQSLRGETQWVDEQINEWVATSPEMATAAYNAIRNLGGSSTNVERLITLVQKAWLQREVLGNLWFGKWLEPLSDALFLQLLEVLVEPNEPHLTPIILELIHRWIEMHQQHAPTTAEYFVTLLKRPPVGVSSSSGWYEWKTICLYYVQVYPVEIVEAAVSLLRYTIIPPGGPSDDRLEVIREALAVAPERIWPIIGQALLQADDRELDWSSLTLPFDGYETVTIGSIIESIDLNILVPWMEQHSPKAPQIFAELIHSEMTPLSAVVRELIIRYDDDPKIRFRLNPLHRSMSWSGPYSARLEAMLKTVRTWLDDEHPKVKGWASEVAAEIDDHIHEARLRDDEDELRWP